MPGKQLLEILIEQLTAERKKELLRSEKKTKLRSEFDDTHEVLDEMMLEFEDDLMSLTPREFEVFKLIGDGFNNKNIGSILGISHRTVELHRHRALQKLEADNTVEAASKFASYNMWLSFRNRHVNSASQGEEVTD